MSIRLLYERRLRTVRELRLHLYLKMLISILATVKMRTAAVARVALLGRMRRDAVGSTAVSSLDFLSAVAASISSRL